LLSSRACADATSLMLGAGSVLSCLTCEPQALTAPAATCTLPNANSKVEANLCAQVPPELPACMRTDIERARPAVIVP
jgi:hypothetical protein